MAFQHVPTFLRSAIAKDPFCLGDLGPEDVLRIEAEFPTLFGEGESEMLVSNQTTKPANVISKSTLPRKHDCLNKPTPATTKPFTASRTKSKSNPPTVYTTGGLSSTTPKTSQVSKILQPHPKERNQGTSQSEMRKASHARDKDAASSTLSLKELKTTLFDILSRAEDIFPPELNLTNGESQTDKEKNLIGYTHGKPDKKSYAQQHIKKEENEGKKASSMKIPSDRHPNTTRPNKGGNENPLGKSAPKRNITNSGKSNSMKKGESNRTGNNTTKSNPGFLRNSIASLPKVKRKSESAPSLKKTQTSTQQNKIRKPEEVTKGSRSSSNSSNDRKKQKKETNSPDKMQMLESLSDSNDSFPEEAAFSSKNPPGAIYFRKSAEQKFGEVKMEENTVKDSVSRFEQLLLARTLAAKYEQKGIFHKHHTFSLPKKTDKKDAALPSAASRTLPQTLFQPTTPSSKKVLEKIAEELIYVEVLKYLDSEQGLMVEQEHINSKNEDTSACVTANEEYRLPEKEAADGEAESEIITANHERKLEEQGLSTIEEEGEESELVTPDLTPPVSLLNANNTNETQHSASSFLSPTTSKDESTLLETPDLTPVRESPRNSSTPSQNKLNARNPRNNILGRSNTNANPNTVSEATSDWSDFSDFLFTDVSKTDLEVEDISSKSSRDKTLEELLVTPSLSNYSLKTVEKSIAEKESPDSVSSIRTPDLSPSHENTRSIRGNSHQSNKNEVGEDESNKTIVKFTSPPAVEFKSPQKSKSSSVKLPTVGIDSGKSKAATTSKLTKSSTWDFTLSETEKSGSATVTTTSYFDQGEITATTADNLSEGEFVGKRYKSPGEMSASFYSSPGAHRLLFSSASDSSSDEDETPSEGDQNAMSLENIANTEYSLGEIGESSRSSRNRRHK